MGQLADLRLSAKIHSMQMTKQNIREDLRDLVEQSLDDGLAFHEVRRALIEVARSLRRSRLNLSLSEADRMIERAVSDLKAAASQYGDKEF